MGAKCLQEEGEKSFTIRDKYDKLPFTLGYTCIKQNGGVPEWDSIYYQWWHENGHLLITVFKIIIRSFINAITKAGFLPEAFPNIQNTAFSLQLELKLFGKAGVKSVQQICKLVMIRMLI